MLSDKAVLDGENAGLRPVRSYDAGYDPSQKKAGDQGLEERHESNPCCPVEVLIA